MSNKLLMGSNRRMISVPGIIWRKRVSKRAQKIEAMLGFMTEEHHLVRDFVVRELLIQGKPLSPEFIAQGVSLPIDRVNAILDDLEKHMTFLFRNREGEVVWAYPVTVEETPHHLTFSTGETIYAA